MNVINLFGGPGCGKSIIASFLFAKFKLLGKYIVEYVNEYAKDCVYENKLNILKYDQLYVFAKQNHKLLMIKNYQKCPDIIITDSPILLSSIYGEINKSISDNFKSLVLETFNSYNNINFFIERDENIKYEENGRIENKNEAYKIDNKIKEYLNKNYIKYDSLYFNDIDTVFKNIIHSNQFLSLNKNKENKINDN